MAMRLHRVCDKPLASWSREPYIPLNLTVSEVITGKSQIEALMLSLNTLIKAGVWDFFVMTERTLLLLSYLFYGLFSAILKMNTIKKHWKQCQHPRSFEVVFTERKRTWGCDRSHNTRFLWQWEILDPSLRSIKANNWSADNFEKKHVTSMNRTLEPW